MQQFKRFLAPLNNVATLYLVKLGVISRFVSEQQLEMRTQNAPNVFVTSSTEPRRFW